MSENNNQRYAEYYFEYKLKNVPGNNAKNDIKQPKLYFERDNSTQVYTLFAVPEEWLNRQRSGEGKTATGRLDDILNALEDCADGETRKNALKKLDYDTVNVVFDIKGVDCSALCNKNSEEYRNAEIRRSYSFEDFYSEGCRIIIDRENTTDHSGIGVIEMIKDGESVAVFYFAVNFTFRKKIHYTLKRSGSKLTAEFKCSSRPKNIPVRIVSGKDYIPCLKNDMNTNITEKNEYILDFAKGQDYSLTVDLTGEDAHENNVFSVTIPDEKLSRFYILDCESNETIKFKKEFPSFPPLTYTCPYCHSPINSGIITNSLYRSGGISCSGTNGLGKDIKITDNHGNPVKKCMYCIKDLNNDKSSPDTYGMFKKSRLLPQAFLNHNNIKIAFSGSPGAGKTTYISRFFDINGSENISMPMTMVRSSLGKFGIKLTPASIGNIKLGKEFSSAGYLPYNLQDKEWINDPAETNNVYIDRSVNLNPARYPMRTTSQSEDYTGFPFIAEVNKRTYVSFYDIAGEDAKISTEQLRKIADLDKEVIGIFCLINANKDMAGNRSVFDMIEKSGLSSDCPIAVILAKFDTVEKNFDDNCHCIRTDYFDDIDSYEGSTLKHEIDYSSEEIRSYLKKTELLPPFDNEKKPAFKNIKYFGVSSFNFHDSIHNDIKIIDQPGRVMFKCSSKRMELPFIWMLSQFNVIK